MSDPQRSVVSVPRRVVLSVGGAGAAGGLLAACGDGGDDGSPSTRGTDPSAPASQSPTEQPATSEAPGAAALVATADVPVGGGVILKDEKLVVTQPTAGEFHAFSATCTHQGCLVTSVGETIDCACHGSRFAIADGSVVAGPAPSALAEESVQVAGGDVVRG